ncbi:hypothetical protein, variant [Saprolegnia diclina VS20]|uniref:Uncharacterized protein n=1 Tax=Saprolegnia diclina (strain VS20) TaxID=1156394 RepID=T0RUJ9_SAPDV|nr:hypothetical protein SDRG_08233 [Saprolegnia diclina VS20]XP_008612329.1 hypothetical protein, variant [Saprolegnia diclina VS20]EQC34016.1 hypothetical protein SDRG_08233 [Saprolegnia diclina VS20]EQC34017.1 hypothetical protein, variant [Saprolegnia diclina VS20]|eukprot:XP_008612328.1 hypothetical protein SDRG_08233 [Saprolegnia diclina VS20]
MHGSTTAILVLLHAAATLAVQDPSLCRLVVLCFTITNTPCNRQLGACPPCLYANAQGGYLCWAKTGPSCPFTDKSELTMFDCSGSNATTPTPTTTAVPTTTPTPITTLTATTTATPTTVLPTTPTQTANNSTQNVPGPSEGANSNSASSATASQTVLMIAIGMGVAFMFVAGVCALMYRREKRPRQPCPPPTLVDPPPHSKFKRGGSIAMHGSQLQRINSGFSSQNDDLSLRSFPTPSSFGDVQSILGQGRDDVQPHSTIHEYIDSVSFAQFYPLPTTATDDISDSVSQYRSTNSLVLDGRYSNFSILSDDPRDNNNPKLRVSWDDDERDKEVEI